MSRRSGFRGLYGTGIMARGVVVVVVLAGAMVSWPMGALRAEFAEPTSMTESVPGAATGVALALDPANNVFVVGATDDGLAIDLIGPNLRFTFSVPGEAVERGQPDVVSNSRGGTYVAFAERVAEGDDAEVVIVGNVGGRFGNPRTITDDAFDDGAPVLALDLDGDPHLAWVKTVGGVDRVWYRDHVGDFQTEVAAGSSPSLWFGQGDVAHVVYVRDGELLFVTGAGGSFSEEATVTRLPSTEDVSTRMVVDDFGNVFVLYASGGSLYFATKGSQSATFAAPKLLDAGSVKSPEMQLRAGGVLAIVYEKAGDLWFVQGVADFLLAPTRVLPASPGAEQVAPAIVVDHCANLHVSYLEGDEIWYTNNAAEVEADFSANPPTGEGPLEVQFQDLSNGKVQLWHWDFGDGTYASSANPKHIYQEPGQYTVKLTVFNADRESVVVKEDVVSVQESSNIMEIPDQVVLPNQKQVWFPVYATHEDPIQGFQVHAVFDPNYLALDRCSQEFTRTLGMDPDVWECNIGEKSVEIGVIFELQPPFVQPELLPGVKQSLVNLVFDVKPNAPQGTTTRVQLTNDRDLSRIFNIFTVNGFTKLPVLKSSTVTVRNPFDGFLLFIRGDVDSSGSVDITDAISLLNYLFLGGAEPKCLDAADVNDTGRADISGAINILNFLFLGGTPPRPPFPNRGIDPTPDELTCST